MCLQHRLGADIKYDLMPALERALRESGNTECSKLANAFTHNIQEYIKSLNIYYKAKVWCKQIMWTFLMEIKCDVKYLDMLVMKNVYCMNNYCPCFSWVNIYRAIYILVFSYSNMWLIFDKVICNMLFSFPFNVWLYFLVIHGWSFLQFYAVVLF